jgi:hypothetical protein
VAHQAQKKIPEKKSQDKRGRGRPKGSKNQNQTEVIFTSELLIPSLNECT